MLHSVAFSLHYSACFFFQCCFLPSIVIIGPRYLNISADFSAIFIKHSSPNPQIFISFLLFWLIFSKLYLLIAILAFLHTALLQSVVIIEEVQEQVPEHARLKQVGLQPEVHTESTDTLADNCTQFGQVLENNIEICCIQCYFCNMKCGDNKIY